MTRRQLRYEPPVPTPDPFAGCCWPKCGGTPLKSEFFCPVHRDQVPPAIMRAMVGAVREVNLDAWRKATAKLREMATSAHG